MTDERPDPQKLLNKIKNEEARAESSRGKLKIFFGYSAGVGKTYAMLEAAHAELKQGTDILVGYVEPHVRPDTQALVEGLPALPSKMIDYKGIQLREFDLDEALKRHPKIILVDELAHSNAAGSRHLKRYQDVEELLEAGINVWTCVNVQHLESLNDLVASITGISQKERVPDRIFDDADQVKLVDIEPDDLLQRLKEGKIYREMQAGRAMENFFTRDKLTALREIALRRMADRVNYRTEIEGEEIPGHYNGEHILTCISPSPNNAKVIRTAARLANAFHSRFTALYVEKVERKDLTQEERKNLERNTNLARTLGAKIATVSGENIPMKIGEYARISNVTKIVMGRTNHKLFMGLNKGTLVENLTQYVPDIDIYVIPDVRNSTEPYRRRFKKTHLSWKDMGVTVLALVLATLAGLLMAHFDLPESNIITSYMIGGIVVAIYTNTRICSIFDAFASVVLFNYYFIEPVRSFETYDPTYSFTFLGMVVLSVAISSVTLKYKREAKAAAKNAYKTELLLENSRQLRRSFGVGAIADTLCGHIQQLTGLSVTFYLKDGKGERLKTPRVYPRKGMTKQEMAEYITVDEQSVALWVLKNGHRAGACTMTLDNAKSIYLPLKNYENVFGVIGIVLEEHRELSPFENEILRGLLNETALVLEKRNTILQAAEKREKK
nr:DUF4118 domain-containing protein [uncultured Sellimonas sp.]